MLDFEQLKTGTSAYACDAVARGGTPAEVAAPFN
jgi:hypothetical protein